MYIDIDVYIGVYSKHIIMYMYIYIHILVHLLYTHYVLHLEGRGLRAGAGHHAVGAAHGAVPADLRSLPNTGGAEHSNT